MPTYHARRGVGTLPEIVLNTAADPTRTAAWVAEPLGLDAGQVRVRQDGGALLVEWEPEGSAVLVVESDGAGAASADLRVRCASNDDDPAERMLDALAGEVGQNLTAG